MGIYFTPKQDTIMKKLCFILLLYAFCLLPLAAQHPPKHEVRAAWITAVYGLDWPRTRATTPESIRKQQAELVEILDKLKAANFNTVLFQTRTRGDVLYQSAIEPYNSILTGKVGGNPGYAPLAFAMPGWSPSPWATANTLPPSAKSRSPNANRLSACPINVNTSSTPDTPKPKNT